MRNQLNLLPQQARLKFTRLTQVERLRFLATIAIFLFLLAGGLILTANLYLRSQAKTVRDNIREATAAIERQKETEIQLFLLKRRTEKIATVVRERKNAGQRLYQIIVTLPDEAKVQSAELEKDEADIDLSFPSYKEASDFIDHYPKDFLVDFKPQDLQIDSFVRQEDGSYFVSINAKL